MPSKGSLPTVGAPGVVHSWTYSSFPELIKRCEDFSQEYDMHFGRIVFTQIPFDVVDELIASQDNNLLKGAKLTYHDSALELKMPFRLHEVAESRLALIISNQIIDQGYDGLVSDLASADIRTKEQIKRPGHSWGPLQKTPQKSTDPSDCKLILEVGASEGHNDLLKSTCQYLEAGVPYVLLLDVSQERFQISLHLIEAFKPVGSRSFASLESGKIVISRDDSGVETSEGDPIRVPIAALSNGGLAGGNGVVVITAEILQDVAQRVWNYKD